MKVKGTNKPQKAPGEPHLIANNEHFRNHTLFKILAAMGELYWSALAKAVSLSTMDFDAV